MKNLKFYLIALPIFLSLLSMTAFKTNSGNPSAHGGGTTIELGEKSTFTFNAVQHNDGSVNGHLEYQFRGGDITFHMDIDCLSITGNRATLSGTVTSVSGNTAGFPFIFEGASAAFTVQDNGQGNNASPDKISDVIFGGLCIGNYPTYLPISGNIQVKP